MMFMESQSLLFRSVFSLYEGRGGDCRLPDSSQSLLFRSVFSLMKREVHFVKYGNSVAIPSIQVGFFTPDANVGIVTGEISRNPFYSGRFFHSERSPYVIVWAGEVAIPSIQVGFFTRPPYPGGDRRGGESQSLLFRSVFSLRAVPGTVRPGRRAKGRNPFYSGRFFHSASAKFYTGHFSRSQSLLFRSVFSLRIGPPCWRTRQSVVAIPSIQVGFFTRRR